MRYLLICVAALLASSCARPAKPQALSGVVLPERWLAGPATNAIIDEPWWDTFGDTNLSLLVTQALLENHDLKRAAARLDAAFAQSRIAGADAFPQVDLGAESRRQQQNFVGLPIPGTENEVLQARSTTHLLSLNLRWELDLWGRIRAGRSAAATDAEGAWHEFEAARLSLAGQVVKTWLAAAEAARQLQLARETRTNYASVARQVRGRYEQGIRTSLELRLALASEASAAALVGRRVTELETSVRQLEVLLGRYPSGQLQIPGVLPAVVEAVPAGLPSELLERRHDLLVAERSLGAADLRVKEAKAALLPRISLTASGGRSSSELEDLLSNQFNIWSLAGNLVQPLFQGGRLWHNVKLARARAREALQGYASVTLHALSEVEIALAAEQSLLSEEDGLREAALQSEAARQQAEERYRSGLENFITLLEAQRRSLEAESQLIFVRRQRLLNRVDLHLALGGGLAPTAP